MSSKKYRLVTRADFDGLVCAALLRELDMIEEIKFAHPKDMIDGIVDITERDITTNLPYDPRCHLSFDHHLTESLRHGEQLPENMILDPDADSAARVVYRHYGGEKRFPNISPMLIVSVDKSDAARFTEEEIRSPTGWVMLNFIMDPRTGLGRFDDFRVSNWELLEQLVEECRIKDVEQILALPDVRERIEVYKAHNEQAIEQLLRCAKVVDKTVILDMRNEEQIYVCNRFMIYALYPEAEVSIHVLWGHGAKATVFAVGKSIINRESPVNVGELCMRFGGGGHRTAGTCQVGHEEADDVLQKLLQTTNADPELLHALEDESMLDEQEGLEAAESVLFDTMAESGMAVMATKQDLKAIHERLDRLEQMVAELAPARTH